MSVNKWNRVDNRGNGLLIEKFEVEEIKAVVWECEGSKSLGV